MDGYTLKSSTFPASPVCLFKEGIIGTKRQSTVGCQVLFYLFECTFLLCGIYIWGFLHVHNVAIGHFFVLEHLYVCACESLFTMEGNPVDGNVLKLVCLHNILMIISAGEKIFE